jgi:hypothetical protein
MTMGIPYERRISFPTVKDRGVKFELVYQKTDDIEVIQIVDDIGEVVEHLNLQGPGHVDEGDNYHPHYEFSFFMFLDECMFFYETDCKEILYQIRKLYDMRHLISEMTYHMEMNEWEINYYHNSLTCMTEQDLEDPEKLKNVVQGLQNALTQKEQDEQKISRYNEQSLEIIKDVFDIATMPNEPLPF